MASEHNSDISVSDYKQMLKKYLPQAFCSYCTARWACGNFIRIEGIVIDAFGSPFFEATCKNYHHLLSFAKLKSILSEIDGANGDLEQLREVEKYPEKLGYHVSKTQFTLPLF